MKKVKTCIFFILFILLSLSPIFGAGVASEENQFGLNGNFDIRNVNWDMSEEEVLGSENYSFYPFNQKENEDYYGENSKAYQADIIIDNTEAFLGYGFFFDRLVRVAYGFLGDEKSYAADLKNFQNYIDLFTNEYGTPELIKDVYPPELFEKKKSILLAGDPDNKYPYYNFTLLWHADDETIALNAIKKEQQYILQILFTSKEAIHIIEEAAKTEAEQKATE
ncbi:MAG: hypothetical protein HQ557_02155 [Bacteroidetes bacterium]|nr:hypothetical protein [Bacteroidota bacterium]